MLVVAAIKFGQHGIVTSSEVTFLGSGKTSKFLIQTDAKKPIFNASTTSYYLKSANWDGKDSDEGTEQGLKIDLSNGIIDSKYVYIGGEKGKFTLNIPADSVGSQFVIKA